MKFVIALFMTVMLASAQEPRERITRMIPVKHLSGSKFNAMIKLLEMLTPRVRGDYQLSTVAVTDLPDVVDAVEAAVRKMDIAPPPDRNVDVSLFVIAGSQKAPEGNVPADLEPVLKQLRGIFPYRGFRLMDSQFLRVREGNGPYRVSGQMADPAGSERNYAYDAQFHIAAAAEGSERGYRLDGFQVSMYYRDGAGKQIHVLGIHTNIDVREGQKAVVGKANVNPESAIFVVVSAK